ncbi:MAG: 4Fe-4S dicluster domain-containing protein [Planctomycetota bacterium]|jgi:molybdopterin-containing oxidoreductase family iron-sulfur binding subunit
MKDGREKGIGRREFLLAAGAGAGALSLSACLRRPEENIVPYLVEPEEVTPGVATWYASTCPGCTAGCGVLVKCRDGRPVKVEGNPKHPISHGGLCARGQATIMDLYDPARFRGPQIAGKPATWAKVDAAVMEELAAITRKGGRIVILSHTVTSPTLLAAIERFKQAYPTTRHVMYDTLSCSAILDAYERTHGKRILPTCRFDKADVIVSFDADFLGTWVSPVEFTHGWAQKRKPPDMSWHVQFESRMSLTGANADLRYPVRPHQLGHVAHDLLCRLQHEIPALKARKLPQEFPSPVFGPTMDMIAKRLAASAGRSLVISGSGVGQDTVNYLNHFLGNDGSTIELGRPSLQYRSDEWALEALVADPMKKGKVGALIVIGADPLHDNQHAGKLWPVMGAVPLSISMALRPDETTARTKFVCPDHHPFESWGDANARVGTFGVFQPVVRPHRDTRSAVESLLRWAEIPASVRAYQKEWWERNVFPRQRSYSAFDPFWASVLRDGVVETESERRSPPEFEGPRRLHPPAYAPSSEGVAWLSVHTDVRRGELPRADNPWLRELPDSVSKTSWDDCVSVSAELAEWLEVEEGKIVELETWGQTVQLAVHIQRGMADSTVAVALGPNADVFRFVGADRVTIRPAKGSRPLAKTQTQDSLTVPLTGEKRTCVRETTLEEWRRDPAAGNEKREPGKSLWPGHEYKGYRWGMAVDLNLCTGCSACVIACQAENNIPVVGREEVRNRREMHWIRIDRYYDGEGDSPRVVFQPVMCQHCENAPCETVCPVLATVHSAEGLNMQVYSRCIGARYCGNNCPYKVRRFNWFDYDRGDPVRRLALNPDVVVRSRGVTEKCTFCVQRITAGTRRARAEGRKVRDGEIRTACAQSCPSGALVFGDLNDPESRVARMAQDPRAYTMVARRGTRPSVFYLTKVRNP